MSRADVLRRYDTKRADDAHWRFLRTREWKRLRAAHLAREPLCRQCLPRPVPAVDVDHIKHPEGDWSLARDPKNLQALCRNCHNAKTRAERGRAIRPKGCDAAGVPLDPAHAWNAHR